MQRLAIKQFLFVILPFYCSLGAHAAPDYLVSLSTVADPTRLSSQPPRNPTRYDLSSQFDRTAIQKELEKLVKFAKLQKEKKKEGEKAIGFEVKAGAKRSFERVIELLPAVAKGGREAAAVLPEIQALLLAFQNSLEYPIKRSYQLLPETPFYLLKGIKHQVVKEGGGGESDPAPSSYWNPRANDGKVAVKTGFGRAALPDFSEPCEYKDPKTGWGAHPGFHVSCGGQPFKFKLGDEIYGGPFNTRLFWLLGYNVTAIDQIAELKIPYTRRVLAEFNSRRHMEFDIRFLFLKLIKTVITNYADPFTFIKYAQLKDGTRISGMDFKKRLLKKIPAGDPTKADYDRPEKIAGNFREDFEATVEQLAFVPGTMATDPDEIKAIGPWKYDDLGADEHREVRGVQIISAWVDEYNMRWENTRLSWVKENGAWSLKHFFSDVGSGFGGAPNILNLANSEPDKMLWRVTEPHRNGVKLKGFTQNMPNPAFEQLTLEDSRWMLRKIAAITEAQIWDMLSATGMSPAERRLSFEKLLSRRAHMLRDFGLAREFPAIMQRKFNEEFNFTPTAADGAGWNRHKVVGGNLVTLQRQ